MFYVTILIAEILTVIIFVFISYKILNRINKILKVFIAEESQIVSSIKKYERARKIEIGLMKYIMRNEFFIIEMQRFLRRKMDYVSPEPPTDYGELLLQLIEEMEIEDSELR